MPKLLESALGRYATAVVFVGIATLARMGSSPIVGHRQPFATFYAAVIVSSWFCGLGPSILAMVLGALTALVFFMNPLSLDPSAGLVETIGIFLYFCVNIAVIAFGEAGRVARRGLEVDVAQRKETEERLHQQREWLRVTLASIGDAVIATDVSGRVAFLNPMAEALTGWTQAEAVGVPLEKVFQIVDESSHSPVDSAANRFLNRESADNPDRHAILIDRDGTERSIDDSASPIRDGAGNVMGAVLIFRDVNEKRRAERALEMNEARKAAILKTALDAIITIDHEGRVIEWNPSAERIFGYSRAEVLNWPLVELIVPPALRDPHGRGLDQYLGAGNSSILGRHIETLSIRADGTELPVELAIAQIPIEGPPIYTAHVRDITERKRAETSLRESERQYRDLAEAMPQIVWTARPDGYIDYYNKRWFDFSGLPEGVFGDDCWKPVLHPEDAERAQKRWQQSLQSGEPFEMEYRFWDRLRGEYRWFLARALAARDDAGRIIKWYGTSTDIGDQKRAEEALREADRRKNEFIATLAHELRNPLAPVRNALELMKLSGENGDDALPLRDMMERQVDNMTRLVEDLLDVSRIDSGKIDLRKQVVDLTTITRHAIDAGRPFLEERKHELIVAIPDESILIEADSTRLEQVLDNLMTNAAKYTDAGGRIWLSVSREGESAIIRLRDTGVGIEPAMLSKVFDLFVQAERRMDRSRGGLGIGLSLVKTLVEMHGGSVKVHSEGRGRGAEFVVRLPVFRGASLANSRSTTFPPASHAAEIPRRRILVVDDNQDAANSLARLLTRLYRQEVRVAYDGPSALEAAGSFNPGLILLDIGLPGMDGYEVARRLRAHPDFNKALLVAVTGWGQEQDRQRSSAAGFDRHLVKPVEMDAVRELLLIEQPLPLA